jgi:ATP-dependent RNA helicase DeaD
MEIAAALLYMQMGDSVGIDDIADYKVPRSLDELGERFGGQSARRALDRKGRKLDGKKLRVKRRDKSDHQDDDMVRLFINIGKNQHVKPGDILGAIAGESGISGRLVGAIDICDSYSFVDVDRKNADKVMRAMKNAKVRGLSVHMEKANGIK